MIIGGLLAGEIGTTRPYGFLYPAESHELAQIMAGQDARIERNYSNYPEF